MPFTRFVVRFAALLLVAAAAPVSAATLTVDIPGCSGVAVAGSGPNYTINCTQQAQICAVNATPASPQGNTSATLSVACTPAATSVTWQGSRDCSTPSIVPGSPLIATVSESGGRSCNYTATANGGGTGFALVVWQGAGTTPPPPPPNAPTGCTITRTPSNGALGASGGAISMSVACSGGGTPTSWSWRRNSANNWSTLRAPTDALPANTGAALVTHTYGVTACAGTACAAEVTTAFTVAGAVAVGFCGQYPNAQIVNLPLGGTLDTASHGGGFLPDGVFVGVLAIPGNVNTAGTGQVRFVEFVDGPAERQMTVSTQPCDFRGFVPGSLSSTDPTGTNYPLKWSNSQTPQHYYQFTSSLQNAVLQPGQTYYFNVRNMNWVSGVPSCQTATCNGRFQMVTP